MFNNWGFVLFVKGELKYFVVLFKYLIVFELILIVEVEGKLIVVVFGFLDYNLCVKLIDGKFFLFGFFCLFLNCK